MSGGIHPPDAKKKSPNCRVASARGIIDFAQPGQPANFKAGTIEKPATVN